MNRCTGHCCKRFWLSSHPSKLLREARAHYESAKPNWAYVRECLRIFRMVRPLGGGFYRCVHHDAKTGNCMNYENRPWMCSAYPYGRECQIDGCTLDV
jgi:Fe-S-cluster containining protein